MTIQGINWNPNWSDTTKRAMLAEAYQKEAVKTGQPWLFRFTMDALASINRHAQEAKND